MRFAVIAAAVVLAVSVHHAAGAADPGPASGGAILAQAGEPYVPPQMRSDPGSTDQTQRRTRPRAAAARRDPKVDTRECTWVGKRTIRVLMRDDLIAAEGFLRFYNSFGCPVRFLGQAFGCAVAGAEGAAARDVEARIDVCWRDPMARPAAAAATPAPKPAVPANRANPRSKPAAQAKPKTDSETAYPKR